jgi:hypothetical protein
MAPATIKDEKGSVEYFSKIACICSRTGMVKKVIQQGHSHFDARSVLPVREHGKRARTPLVAFLTIPRKAVTDDFDRLKRLGNLIDWHSVET